MRLLTGSILFFCVAAATSAAPGRAQSLPALPPDQCRLDCRYRLTYQPDSTDPATRTELFQLQIGSQLSRSVSQARLFRDSLMAATLASVKRQEANGEMPTISFQGIPSSRFRPSLPAIVYKLPGQVLVYDQLGTTPYAYQEPPGALTWAIGTATATVAGYACQQATTSWAGRRWQAWFTREVPVADGPYKFAGLPGLIVRVADGRGQYVFELLKLSKPATPVPIALPEAGAKVVDKATFRQGKADYDRTALTQMLASGNFRFNSAEEEAAAKQRARDRAKKNNNPLELK